MSFDIHVRRFRDGDILDADAALVRSLLAPFLVEQGGGWNLRMDEADAEVYGVETLERGFMVTHVSGVALYDLVVRVAAACDFVIMPVGCPVALTSEQQRAHLPDGFDGDAVVVSSGAELIQLIRNS